MFPGLHEIVLYHLYRGYSTPMYFVSTSIMGRGQAYLQYSTHLVPAYYLNKTIFFRNFILNSDQV
jgi:hypothetical protein